MCGAERIGNGKKRRLQVSDALLCSAADARLWPFFFAFNLFLSSSHTACKLHVFCCPPPFPVISFSCCRITRSSSSSSSQLQLLPFEFRYTFPNINIVAATIHQACRVVSPFRIWRLVVPDLSSTSETSVYCSASWDYWATRKFTTGEREVVGDLTRGNKLLEEEEELWSQVSG